MRTARSPTELASVGIDQMSALVGTGQWGPLVNMYGQVSILGHQMSLAGGDKAEALDSEVPMWGWQGWRGHVQWGPMHPG